LGRSKSLLGRFHVLELWSREALSGKPLLTNHNIVGGAGSKAFIHAIDVSTLLCGHVVDPLGFIAIGILVKGLMRKPPIFQVVVSHLCHLIEYFGPIVKGENGDASAMRLNQKTSLLNCWFPADVDWGHR
jgi:hypothetical protein